ncbi:hypothetical protein D3C76_833490 [compost metagenome]
MFDFSQKPQAIPVSAGVFGHVDEMATAHGALITAPVGLPVIGAVAFQCPIGQMLTALTMGELPWETIILKVRQQRGFGHAVELQTRFLEVVITTADVGRAGFQSQFETVNHRRFADQATAWPVRG